MELLGYGLFGLVFTFLRTERAGFEEPRIHVMSRSGDPRLAILGAAAFFWGAWCFQAFEVSNAVRVLSVPCMLGGVATVLLMHHPIPPDRGPRFRTWRRRNRAMIWAGAAASALLLGLGLREYLSA